MRLLMYCEVYVSCTIETNDAIVDHTSFVTISQIPQNVLQNGFLSNKTTVICWEATFENAAILISMSLQSIF